MALTSSQQPAFQALDPAQIARIPDLQLLARTIVEGFLTGIHRSPHTGSAIEFAQYRSYAQGDDPRFIDWRLYGRTDRLRIKQHQDETNLRSTLLFDCSASMAYTSHAVTKFHYARMLIASLAMLLHYQHDAPGFIGYHHELLTYIPPRATPNHLRRILVELDNLKPEGQTEPGRALHYLGDVLGPRGMVVLVSDLLHPLDEMVQHLKSLRARRHDLIVMQITDPAERDFPFDQSATFVDLESGREQFAIPTDVREQYLANRQAHFDEIRRVCVSNEIELVEFSTDEPLDRALYFFLHKRIHARTTSSSSFRSRGRGAR